MPCIERETMVCAMGRRCRNLVARTRGQRVQLWGFGDGGRRAGSSQVLPSRRWQCHSDNR